MLSSFVKAFLPRHTSSVSHSVVSNSLQPHGLWPTRLLCPWDSLGKNIGVDCHSLLQRLFLTQGLNSGLLHCRQILYLLNYSQRLFISVSKKGNAKEFSNYLIIALISHASKVTLKILKARLQHYMNRENF